MKKPHSLTKVILLLPSYAHFLGCVLSTVTHVAFIVHIGESIKHYAVLQYMGSS